MKTRERDMKKKRKRKRYAAALGYFLCFLTHRQSNKGRKRQFPTESFLFLQPPGDRVVQGHAGK